MIVSQDLAALHSFIGRCPCRGRVELLESIPVFGPRCLRCRSGVRRGFFDLGGALTSLHHLHSLIQLRRTRPHHSKPSATLSAGTSSLSPVPFSTTMARQVRCPRSVLLFAISLLLGNAILAAQAQQALPALPLDERVTGVLAPTPPPSVPSSSSAGTPQLEGSLADAVEQEVCENAQEGGHLLEKRQSSPPASSSTINIPQTAANGGLTMTQPPATAQATVRLNFGS